MLTINTPPYDLVARTIDNFMSLDLTGVGSIGHLIEALRKRQPGHICMGAAELIIKALSKSRGPVLIATGFPEGGGVPETDGPIGAALLARALFLGFGVESVIIVDNDWETMMRATCVGAGLAPMPFPVAGKISPIDFLRPVYICTVPKDAAGCRAVSDDLLQRIEPRLMIAIERPGCNVNGLYHGLGGRPLDGLVGDLDYLFRKGKSLGIPFIGIGDGGNELGMGAIAEDLPTFWPKAKDCGIPGRGGVAAVTVASHLVVSNVSNWGATGIIAALSARLENPVVFHAPELETRCIEQCSANGGVDGMFMAPEPAVDGIGAIEWEGLVRTLRASLDRALGRSVNWKGGQGDWRKSK